MSSCTKASRAPMMIVTPPMRAMALTPPAWMENPCQNTPYIRAPRYTPATTMVAAWIRADTGVGPAIASGSQVWSGKWPSLPMIPARRAEPDGMTAVAGERGLVDRHDVERLTGGEERDDHTDHQPDVAGTRGEEGLQGRVGVDTLLPPVTDEHEGAQSDELPPDEELQRVVGHDEQEHGRGEEAQRGEEVGEATIAVHVRGRVDVNEQ